MTLLVKPTKWKKSHRSYDARLIPERLRELAQKGVYYESKLI